MVLETVCPPIPSEAVLPFAGFLISQGDLNPAAALLAAVFPVGTRVVAVLAEWDPVQPEGIDQVDKDAGHLEGSRLTSPLPRGFFVDDIGDGYELPDPTAPKE